MSTRVVPHEDTAVAQAAKARTRRIRAAWRAVAYVALALGGVSFMLPLAWMISTSFKAKGAVFTYPPEWIPRRQLMDWGQDVAYVDGHWRPKFAGEVGGERMTVAATDSRKAGWTAVVLEPASRRREVIELARGWFHHRKALGGFRKLYWATMDEGSRMRVVELRNVEGGKVVQPPPSRPGPVGDILVLPLYRTDAEGRVRPTFEPIREVHVRPSNYPDAWNALQLRRPWLAFELPALRFRLGGSTYQIGPLRFGGFHIRSAFAAFYLNSVLVAVCVTIGQVLTSSLAAYAFARLHFPGRDKLFLGYLGTLMVPYVVTMIPVFILLRLMHLVDTYAALILPAMFSAYGTFMLRQFFLTIPTELEDAARIDGCGRWGIYANVILPLSKPALATLTTFVFLGNWNSFMWPLIVISSPEKKTLPIGLYAFMGQFSTEWTLLMAASLMVMAPVLLVFVLGQRYFVKGIVMSGIKG